MADVTKAVLVLSSAGADCTNAVLLSSAGEGRAIANNEEADNFLLARYRMPMKPHFFFLSLLFFLSLPSMNNVAVDNFVEPD